MSRKQKLKVFLVLILVLWTFLVVCKAYLFVFERDYYALNASNIDRIEARIGDRDAFSFGVVGNVKNSIKIFDKRIAPLLRETDIDFLISAGNAVYDGAEDKYRMLNRSFERLGIPYILAVGTNEIEDFGAGKFYKHFGPLFFSFSVRGAYFIFLDSTGETSWKWQKQWLEKELALAENFKYRFVILNRSLYQLPGFPAGESKFVLGKDLSRFLQQSFSRYKVTAVFSSGYPAYYQKSVKGVEYFISGCGGGLLLNERKESYQYLRVNVGRDRVTYKNVDVPHRLGSFMYKLETLGFFLHSLFYISLFNFLLIVGIVGLIALKVYSLIIRQETYYRDFNIDEKAISGKPLRVAMFTNNYLPFVGGVPISIYRLYQGLVRLGSAVKIFAPSYQQRGSSEAEDDTVFRCPTYFHGKETDFPITNVFSRRILKAFKAFACDLVHVHHPFWLGKKGMKLAKRYKIPIVFTYHTRLERYTHYIPIPSAILKNLAAHYLIKHFANKCDAIITPTSSTEEYLRHLGVSSLVETIPTGINIREYEHWSTREIDEFKSQYASKDELLLLSVSRMAREKNLDFLVDGLMKVCDRTKAVFKCLLVGDGPEKARLEEKVTGLGLGDRIFFAGAMEPHEVIKCYLASDLFVFASTSETQGMVLLEAMAGGCPVVAVSASGVYDVVEDGHNGYKVPESTDSWAEAVAALLEDQELLRSFSQNSRKFAEKYSVESITEKILRLYTRVLVLRKSGHGGEQ